MNTPFRHIFDKSPEAVLITDTKARIVYGNPAWEKLTKYALSEVKGQNPRLLQSGQTPPRVYKQLWRALKAGRGFQTEEAVDKRKDGRTYNIHSIFYPIIKDGKARYYVQIQHDISRRKISEKQKRMLLSLAAHELKTPLATAKLLAEATDLRLKKAYGRHSKEHRNFALIRGQLQVLSRLVDDILNIGRLETGKLRLHLQPLDLHQLINEVVGQYQEMTASHKLAVYSTATAQVTADADRIRQVLINILSNAVKYSKPQQPIDIHLDTSHGTATVCVEDQGMGIPKKHQHDIFNRFYQIKARNNDGFGLGLYLAEQIIKRHKGKIWVESKVNRGSKFYFSLPLAR